MDIETRDALEADYRRLGHIMATFPRGANGLTSDTAKATPEWRAAKAAFGLAFQRLRAFNGKQAKSRRLAASPANREG